MGKTGRNLADLLAVFCVASFLSAGALADSPREIAKRVSPSVVLLVMEDRNGQPLAMGSGFAVAEGIVATNMHVIDGAANGYAKLVDQKTKHEVRGVVASDPMRDLVLLAVADVKPAPLAIGDSNQVAVGDEVYAVGNPGGLEGTFSAGIVSSVRKVGEDSLLQITAPISPGSSGGPVLNSKGEVVGVAVATFKGGQNLNFAIPSRYLPPLIASAKAPRPLSERTDGSMNGKAKSVIDEFGTRSTEGVQGTQLLWTLPVSQSGGYSFTLRNQLHDAVKDIVCLVVFCDQDGKPIDFDLVTSRDVIPPGLAKRVSSQVDGSVQRLTTPGEGDVPKTSVEFRILSFDIVTGGEAAAGKPYGGGTGTREALMQRLKEKLGSTDPEWTVIEPKIMKVLALHPAAGASAAPQPDVEKARTALQATLDEIGVEPYVIKQKLVALRQAEEKARADARDYGLTGEARERLNTATADLESVLSVRQEALLVMEGVIE